MSNRRGSMKMLAASPLLAQIAAAKVYEKSHSALGLAPSDNVYSRLGVKTVINCRGTWTYLSGSLQFPEVRDAQSEAGRYFVNMVDLHHAVGRRLAELTGAPVVRQNSSPLRATGCLKEPGPTMLRVVPAPPFGSTSLHTRVSARVEQVRELLELRGSTWGITSAVRLHGIFVSDRAQENEWQKKATCRTQ